MDAEKIFWALAILGAGGFFAFLVFGSFTAPVHAAQQGVQLGAQAPPGGQLAPIGSDGVQEVTLSVQGGVYYPNPIVVRKGVPVRLVADIGSMPGCSKSIIIPEFGVQKTVTSSDNTIEFTRTQSGLFGFSCSMNMYRGSIVVQDADGSVAAFTGNAAPVRAGSCGAGSGGCGCGGRA